MFGEASGAVQEMERIQVTIHRFSDKSWDLMDGAVTLAYTTCVPGGAWYTLSIQRGWRVAHDEKRTVWGAMSAAKRELGL